MKVLLTNLTLAGRTGTEVVTRDLALGLRRAGHDPCVFSPHLGTVAEDIAAGGVPVVSRLDEVPFRPDIIHGHHHVETTLALLHFRSVPGIFVCHDRLAWHDTPPRLDAVRRYVAVDHNCLERLVHDAGIPEACTRVIPNAVDLRRFVRRSPLPGAPRRALVFSNYTTEGPELETLRTVCQEVGLELVVAGKGTGAQATRPEEILGCYDLVFAKARCALEAMAAGCAVILYHWQGLGPMVTSAQVRELQKWNFGMRCLQGRLDPDALRVEIARYDSADAARVTKLIRSHASLEAAVAQYVSLYKEVLADAGEPCVTVSELAESFARNAASVQSAARAECFSMPPLPKTIAPRISLTLRGKVPHVRAGLTVMLPVEVDNRSAEVLATRHPFPVHFSYHWLDGATRRSVVFEGERTALTPVIQPGTRHSQEVRVHAPDKPGRYLLLITLVQDRQFWFDTLSPAVAIELDITVCPKSCAGMHTVALGDVAPWVGARLLRDGEFGNLGFLSDPKPRMLTFVENQRFAAAAAACPDLAAVLATADLAGSFPDRVAVAVVDDPKLCFFRIHNRLANGTLFYGEDFPSVIHPGARLHPRCWVDEKNVVIADGVTVAPNAVVLGRAAISAGATIHAGAVIGSAGFQSSRGSGDVVELEHAGGVEIGAGCHIFANAVVARGLFRESTRIGSGCRVGNCAFVSHNCSFGDGVFIGHGAVVNGNVRIGSGAWIGPGATVVHGIAIGEAANISLGSTVMRDVPPGARVTGAVALPHRKMLRLMAAAENDS